MAEVETVAVEDEVVTVPVKSGFLTSEFWSTAGAILANVLVVMVALGRMSPEQADQINTALGQLVTTVPIVIANLLVIWRYIASRTAVKQTAFQTGIERMSLRLRQSELRLKMLEASAASPLVASALSKQPG